MKNKTSKIKRNIEKETLKIEIEHEKGNRFSRLRNSVAFLVE